MTNPLIEKVQAAFRAGYNAGWDSSGEGHNAEYSQAPAASFQQAEDQAWKEYAANVFRTNWPTQGQQGI